MKRVLDYSESFLEKVKPDFIRSLTASTPCYDVAATGIQQHHEDKYNIDTSKIEKIIIPRDYFLPNRSLEKNAAFLLQIRDECAVKRNENPNSAKKFSIEEDVEAEVEKRKRLRKKVRVFAISKLLNHYWVAFHEMVDSSKLKLNNFDEIIAYLEGLYREATAKNDANGKAHVSNIAGYLMYTSFKNIPKWECIQAHEFMHIHNIIYEEGGSGKGCIAKCITDVKSEQNKRLQHMCDKFNQNLTSRMVKPVEGLTDGKAKKRPKVMAIVKV